MITRKLAAVHQNICVVGDDAQSIYAFRGANIQNILNYERDYPDVKTFKLEQNYRSTQNIVNAASSVIKNNQKQLEKNVWTSNDIGEKIKVVRNSTEGEEARRVADAIFDDKMQLHLPNKAFAILYRTNSQSRAFEEALRRQGIDYRIYGGMSFYQRKEVKDLISYLRLVINPSDEEALKRVINYPGRGIGDTTVNRIIVKSSELGVPLWDVVKSAASIPDLGASAGKVDNFATMIKSFQTMLETHNAYDLAMHVAKQAGLLKLLYDDKSVEGVSRYENITELLNGIQEFVEDDESEKEKNLATFLEDVALYTDDQKDKDPDRDCVSLMTIHASKGLEYPVVFIVGIEENLFPSQLSLHSRADLEEERRLFYVAITRAETKCYMTFATSRFKYGSLIPCEPSRFIQEIDPQYLDMSTASLKSNSPFGANSGVGGGVSAGGYIGGQYASKKVEDKPTKTSRLFNVSKPPSPPVPPADPNFVEGDISGLKVGDKVQHQRFGLGEVISIEGDKGNEKAIVNFEQMGQKTLVLKFAKMRIL
jgi:DNA helicase-2/ATP-dependent DNA helicase PcrA